MLLQHVWLASHLAASVASAEPDPRALPLGIAPAIIAATRVQVLWIANSNANAQLHSEYA